MNRLVVQVSQQMQYQNRPNSIQYISKLIHQFYLLTNEGYQSSKKNYDCDFDLLNVLVNNTRTK